MNVIAGIAIALCAAASLVALPAAAQTYPSKSIRLVNPFPAGGPADAVVRPIAQRLSETTKVQWVVDNRAGVNGVLGSEIVVRAPADGYTLLIGSTSSLPMNSAIYPKLPFDPLKDLAPVSAFTHTPQVMVVHPSVPAKTVKELIALGRARQGQQPLARGREAQAFTRALEQCQAVVVFQRADLVRKRRLGQVHALGGGGQLAGVGNGDEGAQVPEFKDNWDSPGGPELARVLLDAARASEA